MGRAEAGKVNTLLALEKTQSPHHPQSSNQQSYTRADPSWTHTDLEELLQRQGCYWLSRGRGKGTSLRGGAQLKEQKQLQPQLARGGPLPVTSPPAKGHVQPERQCPPVRGARGHAKTESTTTMQKTVPGAPTDAERSDARQLAVPGREAWWEATDQDSGEQQEEGLGADTAAHFESYQEHTKAQDGETLT
ncbi:hypothetical protein NDU88_002194 [Pleurodeles waltl]|uniref:Uncharacterized protein n=1 Tax=Pleurodeles waltl TaxID=8319 RepID=A0AAV7TMK3_PLEWA|nr:hypothetical protein NDU88_002194 [Pleurodeles waltl]